MRQLTFTLQTANPFQLSSDAVSSVERSRRRRRSVCKLVALIMSYATVPHPVVR